MIFHFLCCVNNVIVCGGVSMISVYVRVRGLGVGVSPLFECNFSHQVFHRGPNLLGGCVHDFICVI